MKTISSITCIVALTALSGKVQSQFQQGGSLGGQPQFVLPPGGGGGGGGGIGYPGPNPYPMPGPYPPPYHRERDTDGSLLTSILGGVFGSGGGGVGVQYGRGGLLGGILDSIFGNECKSGIIGAVLGGGSRGRDPKCHGGFDYISLSSMGGGRGQIVNAIEGPQNTQIINIQGMPTGPNNPNGILQIQGPKQAFHVENGQYMINSDPNVHYKLSYF